MTIVKAREVLQLTDGHSSRDATIAYQGAVNKYNILLSNAPSSLLREKYQQQITEIEVAYKLLSLEAGSATSKLPALTQLPETKGDHSHVVKSSSKQAINNSSSSPIVQVLPDIVNDELESEYTTNRATRKFRKGKTIWLLSILNLATIAICIWSGSEIWRLQIKNENMSSENIRVKSALDDINKMVKNGEFQILNDTGQEIEIVFLEIHFWDDQNRNIVKIEADFVNGTKVVRQGSKLSYRDLSVYYGDRNKNRWKGEVAFFTIHYWNTSGKGKCTTSFSGYWNKYAKSDGVVVMKTKMDS